MKAGRLWCIYHTTNLVNGKTYIGQHKYHHLYDSYIGSGKILKDAIRKYGTQNFKIEYLVTKIPNVDYANKAEQMYIELERKKGKAEYNIQNGGKCKGAMDESTRRKISLANIGNKKALGKNIGNKNALGNVLPIKTRRKMGESRMGNTNNGCVYIRCIETGIVLRTREWIKQGFGNAYSVAKGRTKTCKGLHFEYVTV